MMDNRESEYGNPEHCHGKQFPAFRVSAPRQQQGIVDAFESQLTADEPIAYYPQQY